MHANTRACIALTALKKLGVSASSIYDYSQSKYISIDGKVTDTKVDLYDYDRGCHFGGSGNSLYDYGRSCHVDFKMYGNKFSGYDYGSSGHFEGTVSGKSVSLYDYSTSSYFNYSS